MESDRSMGLRVAVLTVSDTRTLETDKSGDLICERLRQHGHDILHREIVKDELLDIRASMKAFIEDENVELLITSGGTGFARRDVTPQALQPLIDQEIPGFGELFRMLSYEEIGSSTIQSRALAAICGGTLCFVLPGSTGACKTAMDRIILEQIDRKHRPCNFAEILDLGQPS